MLITLTGVIRRSRSGWMLVDVDPEFIRYYRSLIPRYKCVNQQKYDSHVTVVNPLYERVDISKYDGESLAFDYDNLIKYDTLYYYLDVHSDRIGDIRAELGLSRFIPGRNCYHITIANCKRY